MIRFLGAILIMLLCSTSYAQIYKWTDANGNAQFSDTPPKQGGFDTLNIPSTPSPSNISAPPSNNDEAAKLRQQKLLDSYEQERQAKEKIQKDLAQKKEKLNQTCIQAKDYLRKLKVGGIYTLDAQGNKVYKPEFERAQAVERVQSSIKQHCR
ncbi:MAG: DUF4124 domain-containing protein [Moraxellaceae bacterium]|nr:DUF4124 domain-containing protein [Moraxellaceae bacterium]